MDGAPSGSGTLGLRGFWGDAQGGQEELEILADEGDILIERGEGGDADPPAEQAVDLELEDLVAVERAVADEHEGGLFNARGGEELGGRGTGELGV